MLIHILHFSSKELCTDLLCDIKVSSCNVQSLPLLKDLQKVKRKGPNKFTKSPKKPKKKASYHFFILRPRPRWPLSCMACVPLLAKQDEQNLHLYGFSPVWILLWSSSRSFSTKPLPHTSHLNLFWLSGVCADCITR